MIVTTTLTTIVWLSSTFLTEPEPQEKLQAFYDLVRPASFGWKPFAKKNSLEMKGELSLSFFHWILGCSLIYGVLFGTGDLLFGRLLPGFVLIGVGVVGAALLFWSLERNNWNVFR